MDLRVEKTENCIINAFIGLRSEKPLEKITVKELCERARINKSTFYTHYTDLYALSDTLESDLVKSIVRSLSMPEAVFERPADFTRELFCAYLAKNTLIRTLFSGSRSGNLVRKIEESLKMLIFEARPQYRDDPVKNILLSYVIYGGYYAFVENPRYDTDQVISVIAKASEEMKELFK